MASTSTSDEFSFLSMRQFPSVINGRINIVEYLAAASDLITLLERFGTIFTPVRIDLQGNIDKIKKQYKYDENSCLLELMLDEKARGEVIAAGGCLWLNRGLLFFEILFMEMKNSLQKALNPDDINMKQVFTRAYEGSVKQFHNWVTQQLFTIICKMSPNMPQIMRSLNVNQNNVKEFETSLESFSISLHLVRCKTDDFFRDTNILSDIPNKKV
ncbi:glycolipid transfer protein-like [Anticarsia gemmatalis]|uniref:glycolipid transfer protein-like n=1 Tax=Anticarsia gemmatalis TaxID=129554 RepID=UPI003F75ADC4